MNFSRRAIVCILFIQAFSFTGITLYIRLFKKVYCFIFISIYYFVEFLNTNIVFLLIIKIFYIFNIFPIQKVRNTHPNIFIMISYFLKKFFIQFL